MNLRTKFATALMVVALPFMGKAQVGTMASVDYKNVPTVPVAPAASSNDNVTAAFETVSDPVAAEPKFKEGHIGNAIDASFKPDARIVGFYLTVAKQNDATPEQWAEKIQQYFDAYRLPVEIILDSTRPEGASARARIYIDGVAYDGNLSNGNVGLRHFFTKHKEVFRGLGAMYKEANPDLYVTSDLSLRR